MTKGEFVKKYGEAIMRVAAANDTDIGVGYDMLVANLLKGGTYKGMPEGLDTAAFMRDYVGMTHDPDEKNIFTSKHILGE